MNRTMMSFAAASVLAAFVVLAPAGRAEQPPAVGWSAIQGRLVLFGIQRVSRTPRRAEIVSINPDGTALESLGEFQSVDYLAGRVSPDARQLAVGMLKSDTNKWETWIWNASEHRKLSDPGGEVRAWSPDGSSLVCFRWIGSDSESWQTLRINVATGAEEAFPLPKTDVVEDWSPDGEFLSVMAGNVDQVFKRSESDVYPLRQIDLLAIDSQKRQRITLAPQLDSIWSRFSPDGARIAHEQRRHEAGKVFEYYVVHDRRDSKTTELLRPDKLDEELRQVESFPSYPYYWVPHGFPCWSPDGTRVAVCLTNTKWASFHRKPIDEQRLAIVFCTPSGQILNVIDLQKLGIQWVMGMDWR